MKDFSGDKMKRYGCFVLSILILIVTATACMAPDFSLSKDKKPTETTVFTMTANTGLTENTAASNETSDISTTIATGNPTTKKAATTAKPTTKSSAATTGSTSQAPKPDTGKEFKGVWVSYIELNRLLGGKSAAQAKSAIDDIMVSAKTYGLNAVIFHVRANSDAYYKSALFNEAKNLNKLINTDGFDPLDYAVSAAHSRGLELHAWINPYRVGTDVSYAKNSDYFSSGGRYYYNPSSTEVQKLVLDGIAEITTKYDVDGIQFDDYFYPADNTVIPVSAPASFEAAAYNDYIAKGGGMSIADWRRMQVSSLISSAYAKVHATRAGCVFGVSPRAVMNQNYNLLYADVGAWIRQKGYVDYICPQVYFGFLNKTQPFDKCVDTWTSYPRDASVRLYIGLALYKTGMATDANAGSGAGKQEWATHDDIMKRSTQYIRSKTGCSGMIFYSYGYFKPSTVPDESGWNKDITTREVQNLLSVLA